ncbi:hypothetical protein [Bergeyella zoohelcum]|uniref:Uncharacterized protein n=1 Tax=Bergeyella zoohelcum ATCC 43767 TaxID=883096 RepID=K1LQB5_9FLAO|nr:hypothetical protein [Bergeyella zoohelcum]EKB57006.1 hypothetical protein HMPREF9699_01128 [Bergeyella zoohelcum ATCC 43767]SUV48689.1 Uncharacterised protein [Bergeyella zoohelcum]
MKNIKIILFIIGCIFIIGYTFIWISGLGMRLPESEKQYYGFIREFQDSENVSINYEIDSAEITAQFIEINKKDTIYTSKDIKQLADNFVNKYKDVRLEKKYDSIMVRIHQKNVDTTFLYILKNE